MPSPTVSIVVPVYNGANYLREAIDSALAQDWPDLEVIVVNDGSTDQGATASIAKSYGTRVRLIEKSNGGVGSALNAGIAAMRGDVFCWLSHDDIHLVHKTSRQVAVWTDLGCPEAILYSDYTLIDAEGMPITDVVLDHAMLESKPLYALLRGSVHGCSVFVPRVLFDVIGMFDPARPTTQDYDLWFRMIQRYRFVHIPEILIKSRRHDEQGSKRIDHRVEANALWSGWLDQVPAEQQIALEGSARLFQLEMERFLRANALDDAANHAAALARSESLVSVVVDLDAHPERAVTSVDSVLVQEGIDLEVIVVIADTAIAQAAELRHMLGARAGVILLDVRHLGIAAARNAAWQASRGRHIAFLHAGDLFLPGKLAAQLGAMEAAQASMSYSGYWRADLGTSGLRAVPLDLDLPITAALINSRVATSTVMIRRDLADVGLQFDERLPAGAESILWLRIAGQYGVLGLDQMLTIVRNGSAGDMLVLEAGILRAVLHAVETVPELDIFATGAASLRGDLALAEAALAVPA